LKRFNASQNNSDDNFTIAVKKFGNDLKMIDHEQRVIAEKLVSDVLYYAKLNKLTEYYSINLGMPSSQGYRTVHGMRQNQDISNVHHTYEHQHYADTNTCHQVQALVQSK
jgi:hypothetical protein